MTTVLTLPSNHPLLERARAEPPHWAGERIRAWPADEYQDCRLFTRRLYWCDSASINVFLVIGTQHPDYIGLTWLEFLEQGKRMRGNLLEYRTNPGYYLETARKRPSMFFETFNGHDYYVAEDGNHRTAIARFAAFNDNRCLLHGVNVIERDVDWEMLGLWQRLKDLASERRIAIGLKPSSYTLSRQDTGGWKLENYSVGLLVEFGGRSGRLDRDCAFALLQALQAPRWRRWFGIRRVLQPVKPACAAF